MEKLTKLLLQKWFKSEDEHLVGEWLEFNVEHLRSLASRCGKLKSIQVSKQLTKLREQEVSGCSDLEELPGQVLNI